MTRTGSTLGFDITIAGAGPAGLACALSLAESGWRVGVIDPAPDTALSAPSFDGREIALTHHSRSWLQTHDVWRHIPSECVSPLKTARIETGQEAPDHPLMLDIYLNYAPYPYHWDVHNCIKHSAIRKFYKKPVEKRVMSFDFIFLYGYLYSSKAADPQPRRA